MAAFPDHVRENPVLIPPLKVTNINRGQLRPSEATPQQDGNHRIVTLAAQASAIKYPQKRFPLGCGKPVSDPDATFLCAFDSPDTGSKVRAQKSGIGGLIGEAANGGEAQIDCG